ncbi:hypothetical protein M3693_05050 [Cellulosimicrobium funkei]|uniref:hypothetical protein n=1 Tax=Cellulosimicrobium TaxID=157920 RepID=UPI00203FE607|nr:hypothetical protein [Cellulosimicrobium funkei]MCM3533592.1 hypothetical protein [Cellulosimicrobium funkei]
MVPARRPAARTARLTAALALTATVALLGACASGTDGGGDGTSATEETTEPSTEPTDDATDEQQGLPDAATMDVVAGAHGKGLPPGADAPTEGGTGAAWSAEPGLLLVVTFGSSTCPLLAEDDAAVEGSDVVVSFVDIPADTACTMDYVPATSVVAVPDDVDPGADVSVVLGDRGTVVVPPPAEGAAGEFAWTAG